MAKAHGKTGSIYWKPTITAATIAFVDSNPDTITDSGSGFVTAGFKAGDVITITGAAQGGNNTTHTIASVVAGTITLAGGDAVVVESAGATVTIVADLPGQILLNFSNWTLTYNDSVAEVSDFDSSGATERILGKTDWEVTADAFWDTVDSQSAWLGAAAKTVYLFGTYNASPDVTTAYYWTGDGLTSVWGMTASGDDVIKKPITIMGTGAVTPVTRTTAWPS